MAAVVGSVVTAEILTHAGHAACWYSLMRLPRTDCRRVLYFFCRSATVVCMGG
jgi:hypothetical protein